MSLPRLSAILPLVLALLAGCDSAPSISVSTTGAMRLAISTPLASPSDVSRVTVTVSASDMNSLSTELVLTDGVWGGVMGDIPAGAHRTFVAQAFTASNTLRYEGRAEDVTVTAGTTGLISLTLQDVSGPPPLTNEAPIVDSLVATPTTVAPGGSITLTVSAHDPNPGDTVSFEWTAPSGSFSAPTQASTTWTAPATQGPVTLSLKVSDSHGASLSVSLTVTVSAGSGAEEVKVGFNTAPRVVGLTSSQSWLDVGQQTALSVSATDVDGDTLSYQWSATCAGSFTGASAASATFTPSALPTAACNNCQLSVTVKDGRGGQNTGSVALCVAKDSRRAPPMVTRSYQSSLTASASQQLTFEVEASDPAGSALTFAWTANVGTLGTATSGATSSRITWTAPACLTSGTTPSLTATVTNAFGLTVTRSFTVTGPPTCAIAGWTSTGSLLKSRFFHTATLLPNGKVLAAGGYDQNGTLGSAELYDPATGTWSATGSMTVVKGPPMATLLSTGKVLIMATNSQQTELYDPATGTWKTTGSYTTPRQGQTMTLLPNGKVLVAGGYFYGSLATAEVYDPTKDTWSATSSMSTPRFYPTATLLPNGKVLVAGGSSGTGSSTILATAELYDPATGTWSPTGSMSTPRDRHTATLLPNGKVLVASGYTNSGSGGTVATAELYDPATGTWSATGSLAASRYLHSATLLPNGKVLISDGVGTSNAPVTTPELYDPATGTWSTTLRMSAPRERPTVTLLSHGKVLVSGGSTSSVAVATAELYTPGN
ncbi:kelch-like protein [Archangium minus]|uniref:Kelch-like protein n=1 Tax=Archangium minus TaxID=83450 RepID=A0ABY9WH34_9BACT|nr:kelch-like protein [Archangium minus]